MRSKAVILLSFLAAMALACNLLSKSGPTAQAPGNSTQPAGNQPGQATQPPGTPLADPVSINQGLGSLNSYQMTIKMNSVGPDPSQSSDTKVKVTRSRDADASYTHLTMTSIKAGETDPNDSDTSIYQIGNDQCSGSGEDWNWATNSPAETEMTDLIKSMIGFTPLIENPTFVGQETVNDIPSNHFTFTISGLGVKSGAEVRANQGDYWLAIDGQYIVKYNLVLETSMEADAQILHEEISVELTQVNQPVEIAFPQSCLDASKVTPTP
jgi:hypothetical protein